MRVFFVLTYMPELGGGFQAPRALVAEVMEKTRPKLGDGGCCPEYKFVLLCDVRPLRRSLHSKTKVTFPAGPSTTINQSKSTDGSWGMVVSSSST